MTGDESSVRSVSFDGEGLLVSGSDDGTIKLTNTKTGECFIKKYNHKKIINVIN